MIKSKEVKVAIEKLDYYDLKQLATDLENGGLRRFIYNKIGKYEEGKKVCVNCGNSLTNKKFSLVFEEDGYKKTAEFCAVDCLEYFLNRIKTVVQVE